VESAKGVSLVSIASTFRPPDRFIVGLRNADNSFVPIPQSKSAERIAANANLFDFALDDDDMEALDGLEIGDEAAASVAALKEVRGP
jgi:hypothetical protein